MAFVACEYMDDLEGTEHMVTYEKLKESNLV